MGRYNDSSRSKGGGKNFRSRYGGSSRPTYNQGQQAGQSAAHVDPDEEKMASRLDQLFNRAVADDRLDERFGFAKLESATAQLGWLLNMQPTVVKESDSGQIRSAVDYYFMQEDGGRFKICLTYQPYFLIRTKPETELEVLTYLQRKYENRLARVEVIEKVDLDQKNHLIGLHQNYVKLSFHNVQNLLDVRRDIKVIVKRNQQLQETANAYHGNTFVSAHGRTAQAQAHHPGSSSKRGGAKASEAVEHIADLREYDVPYHMRVAIDNKINVGKWYMVQQRGLEAHVEPQPDLMDKLPPEPIVLAWDIETTKMPLKFPNSETDVIMMVSYMLDGRGYLIVNREIVSQDIEAFEYTPKPEYEGMFEVVNAADEKGLLEAFFEHIREVKPHIMVTYNGDGFDWPFMDTRCGKHDLDLFREIGFRIDNNDEYKSRFAPHMDAFRWVKRDSYLPVGSQGLKAVTKAKLKYDPLEIHYEDICRMASEQPQELANYSVSDAVATYYLYMKYVHPFIFALCTIIPLGPDDVLRKGSGTLCESLLMTNAYHANIVMPNKQETPHTRFYGGHLMENETYIGGHVEALESGVFRNDIECQFRIVPAAIQGLIDSMDDTLKHTIEEEEGKKIEDVENLDDIKAEIITQLEDLRDTPLRKETPLIYHLDVAAMYPNIILTNRLQPMAMVDEATCAACDFNREGSNCQRPMEWSWRGEYLPASRSDYERIKLQLESEKFPGEEPEDEMRPFHRLPVDEQARLIKKRLADYSKKVYNRTKETKVEDRQSTVCMRENPFYIDTVLSFRDRRYDYKRALKRTKGQLKEVEKQDDPMELKRVKNLVTLYDSLQLAHKCILNSFYGYVMRKGARWYSMEMAGIVCLTGANIITKAREIVEQIGRPLELDTDGIWCCLPSSFPENFELKLSGGGKLVISYPGAVLNVMVKKHFTNDQYQTLTDPQALEYKTTVVNSIFFEVDGPYKAMILPASKEKDKKLKKRYAVFELDGSLAELKGFEVKRRGELKIIKIFQSSVFEAFLHGDTLEEVYDKVAVVADHWLDVLYTRGADLADHELFDLISENRSMSRTLADYGDQKSTSISTAKRLAEFLGDEMVKDKGLACQFIIARKPEGAPVTERAIPIAIFSADEPTKKHWLRRWMKTGSQPQSFDIRDILDWEYYIERVGSTIQKIITIPAALQGVSNPVPRVKHPDWLHKRLVDRNDPFKQQRITDMFKAKPPQEAGESLEDGDRATQASILDIEDQLRPSSPLKLKGPRVTLHNRRRRADETPTKSQEESLDWRALGEAPDRCTDMEAWLAFQKKKWRMQRKARKQRKLAGVSDLTIKSRGGGLTAFFARQTISLTQQHWQIIQIAPTSRPGHVKVWCMVQNDLHCMQLNIRRKFLVNLRVPDATGLHRRVNRLLPRSQPSLNLYEFNMTEQQYLENSKVLEEYFTHPDVEGVYERSVALDWQAIVELGCVPGVKPKAAAKRGANRDDFSMEELQFKTTAECDYLSSCNLHRIFIHYSFSGPRMGLLTLYSSATNTASFIFINQNRQRQLPQIKAAWKEIHRSECETLPLHVAGHGEKAWGTVEWSEFMEQRQQGMTDDQRIVVPDRTMAFRAANVATIKEAAQQAQSVLRDYAEERHGPTMILLKSTMRQAALTSLIPSLSEYPIVTVPGSPRDNVYEFMTWQQKAARRSMTHFMRSHHLITEMLETARYAHVPVGNLPSDTYPFICDVFFARALRKHNHVLWASPSPRPDLGGREDDDNRLMTELGDVNAVEINEPGVYPGVCVELEIVSLAVTTIIQSAHINDLEGATGVNASFDAPVSSLEDMMGGEGLATQLTMFDETAQCMPSFRILKGLIHTWLTEVTTNRDQYADWQLIHFYRWLKNSNSLLYDPALVRMVRSMMKKLFLQLIAEFRRLGCTIVYASFTKIVVATNKTNIADGQKHMRFILDCIHAKDLFKTIEFQPECYWEFLVWMDTYNKAGLVDILGSPRKRRRDEEEEKEEDSWGAGSGLASPRSHLSTSNPASPSQARSGRITAVDKHSALLQAAGSEMKIDFNIAEFLPQECARHFRIQLFKWIIGSCRSRLESRLDRGGLGPTPIKRSSAEDQAAEQVQTFEAMRKELLDIVLQLDAARNRLRFPRPPGSHLRMDNPALELTKMWVRVFSLSKALEEPVYRFRADAMRLIRVREFSEEARFENPCLSFVLSEVICKNCNHCSDLDLCRNATTDETEDADGQQQKAAPQWLCLQCSYPYSKADIEVTLIDIVQRQIMAFQLQDLVCKKCRAIKTDNMGSYCKCSGDLGHTVSRPQLIQQHKTLLHIARFTGLSTLEEIVTWALGMNGEDVSLIIEEEEDTDRLQGMDDLDADSEAFAYA